MHPQSLQHSWGSNQKPHVMERWEERSSSLIDRDDDNDDPATHVKYTQPPIKVTSPPSPTKSAMKNSSSSQDGQQYHHHYEYQPRCQPLPNCYGYDSCVPGLSLLSDSEDSSFSSSCGTEELFDFEDLTNAFHLMDKWKNQNRVRFGKAKVREYSLTVGDHPICKDGLALSLDWNHSAEHVYNIEDYERRRLRRRNTAYRGGRTLRLDYWQRREILQRVGSFTNYELSKIERQRQEQAVSEFLASTGPDELDPDEEHVNEQEEILQGVELLEMEQPEDDLITGLSYYDPRLEWHMKVKVIDD